MLLNFPVHFIDAQPPGGLNLVCIKLHLSFPAVDPVSQVWHEDQAAQDTLHSQSHLITIPVALDKLTVLDSAGELQDTQMKRGQRPLNVCNADNDSKLLLQTSYNRLPCMQFQLDLSF